MCMFFIFFNEFVDVSHRDEPLISIVIDRYNCITFGVNAGTKLNWSFVVFVLGHILLFFHLVNA